MISKGFFKSSIVYSVFGALPLASSIILLPFYTNLLSKDDFGVLAIFISFTLLIQIIVNFSFDALVGIHYFEYKDDPEKFKQYAGTVNLVLIFIGIGFTLFSLLTGPSIFKFVFSGTIDFFPYGFMSVVTAIFNSYFKTYTFLLVNQQRPMRFLWMNSFNFILTVVISIVGLYMYPHTLVGPMYGRLLSGVGIFLLSLFYFQNEFGTHFKTKLLTGAMAFCIPIVLFALMSWVISYIDRYIVKFFSDSATVGLYDFGVKCTLLIDFTMAGLTSAINPKIFSIWQEQKINHGTPEINKYYHSSSAINIMLAAGTIFFIPLIVPFVVKNHFYYQAFLFLPLLSISLLTRSTLYMYAAPPYFFKKTSIMPKVFFINALIQFVLSVILIKYFGIMGAVWSLVIIKPIQIMLLAWQTNAIFKFSFSKIKMIYLPLTYAAIVIAFSFFTTATNYNILNSISFILALILIYIAYRNEIFQSIVFFRKKYL